MGFYNASKLLPRNVIELDFRVRLSTQLQLLRIVLEQLLGGHRLGLDLGHTGHFGSVSQESLLGSKVDLGPSLCRTSSNGIATIVLHCGVRMYFCKLPHRTLLCGVMHANNNNPTITYVKLVHRQLDNDFKIIALAAHVTIHLDHTGDLGEVYARYSK